jgi:hypothetical protein
MCTWRVATRTGSHGADGACHAHGLLVKCRAPNGHHPAAVKPASCPGNSRSHSLLVFVDLKSVRLDQTYSWLFFVLIFSSPLFPQSSAVPDSDSGRSENVSWNEPYGSLTPLEQDSQGQTPVATSTSRPEKRPYGWDIAIYPALAWAPVFGVGFTLPPVVSNPIAPAPSASVSSTFNGAYFGGARIEKHRWSADLLFMWAALSANRETPLAKINLDFVFGHIIGGREILPGFYVEGGARRVALNIDATIGTDSASRSPGFWDPLIGVTYRRQLGKKWRILLHGDGGGFGAGSDVDITATGRAEWQFARHFGLAMGYGGLHLSESNTVAGKTLTVSPTLHGPIFGFGIFF